VLIAPRLPHRLLVEFERLYDSSTHSAELCRRLGERAERLGYPRPSYETVRKLVRRRRDWRPRDPTTGAVLLDVMFRVRPPEAIFDHLAGIELPLRARH
jgi:hypothetical protein